MDVLLCGDKTHYSVSDVIQFLLKQVESKTAPSPLS
jgi:hypothetical protein